MSADGSILINYFFLWKIHIILLWTVNFILVFKRWQHHILSPIVQETATFSLIVVQHLVVICSSVNFHRTLLTLQYPSIIPQHKETKIQFRSQFLGHNLFYSCRLANHGLTAKLRLWLFTCITLLLLKCISCCLIVPP